MMDYQRQERDGNEFDKALENFRKHIQEVSLSKQLPKALAIGCLASLSYFVGSSINEGMKTYSEARKQNGETFSNFISAADTDHSGDLSQVEVEKVYEVLGLKPGFGQSAQIMQSPELQREYVSRVQGQPKNQPYQK